MSISVKQKKDGIRARIAAHMAVNLTLLKEEADKWDTEMYGDVVINGNTNNAVKTHVSEIFEEFEMSGEYMRTRIPSRKGNGHKQLLLVKKSAN
jgi:hypothetical protein